MAGLIKALDSTDGESRVSAIWALGSSGDATVVPKLQPLAASPDKGIRKMVVYALGALPGETQLATLRAALDDPEPDRQYVEQQVKRDVGQNEDRDPIADVMISGLRAAATLKDEALRPSVTTLSLQDRSMKVRQAALEALKVMG